VSLALRPETEWVNLNRLLPCAGLSELHDETLVGVVIVRVIMSAHDEYQMAVGTKVVAYFVPGPQGV
jgi:hypothetical protein